FVNDLNGEIDLYCFKLNKSVTCFESCKTTEKLQKERKIENTYLRNYKNKTITEIAEMLEMPRDTLYGFVVYRGLPMENVRYKKTKE
ncbi:MAG: hypothetical protein II598_01640, partial [Elusimicrobia bacterium]|nr:hypothetical protein [Elusimicrobiota bacterium]